jgi:hypothetical protein
VRHCEAIQKIFSIRTIPSLKQSHFYINEIRKSTGELDLLMQSDNQFSIQPDAEMY